MSKENNVLLIKPREWLHRRTGFKKKFKIKALGRVPPYLSHSQGEIEVAFDVKEKPYERRLMLVLHIRGSVCVICQRCNEGYDHPLDIDTTVLIESGKVEHIQIDKEYESVVLDSEGELDMLSVVTDEIVLGLPFAHKGECPSTHYRKYVYNAA